MSICKWGCPPLRLAACGDVTRGEIKGRVGECPNEPGDHVPGEPVPGDCATIPSSSRVSSIGKCPCIACTPCIGGSLRGGLWGLRCLLDNNSAQLFTCAPAGAADHTPGTSSAGNAGSGEEA